MYCDVLTTVYYGRTEDKWSTISIEGNNGCLNGVRKYYFSQTEPEKDGDVYTLTHTEKNNAEYWETPYEEALSNCVMIKEDLTNGQSVESFSVYAYLPCYRHKKILVFEGKTIGHKVLCKFSPLRASKYEVVINSYSGDYAIKDIKAFYVK